MHATYSGNFESLDSEIASVNRRAAVTVVAEVPLVKPFCNGFCKAPSFLFLFRKRLHSNLNFLELSALVCVLAGVTYSSVGMSTRSLMILKSMVSWIFIRLDSSISH